MVYFSFLHVHTFCWVIILLPTPSTTTPPPQMILINELITQIMIHVSIVFRCVKDYKNICFHSTDLFRLHRTRAGLLRHLFLLPGCGRPHGHLPRHQLLPRPGLRRSALHAQYGRRNGRWCHGRSGWRDRFWQFPRPVWFVVVSRFKWRCRREIQSKEENAPGWV